MEKGMAVWGDEEQEGRAPGRSVQWPGLGREDLGDHSVQGDGQAQAPRRESDVPLSLKRMFHQN